MSEEMLTVYFLPEDLKKFEETGKARGYMIRVAAEDLVEFAPEDKAERKNPYTRRAKVLEPEPGKFKIEYLKYPLEQIEIPRKWVKRFYRNTQVDVIRGYDNQGDETIF